MAHLGWIFPAVGGYLGGILTTLFGLVGKYSLDRAGDLRDLIDKIRREVSDFEKPLSSIAVLGPGFHGNSVRVNSDFSKYASDLKSKLDLIPWYSYVFLIRLLHLVPLPPKKKIRKAAELLPQLPVQEEVGDPQLRQEALSIAKKIKDLLA